MSDHEVIQRCAVYLIQSNKESGPSKIGIGENPLARLRAFQTGNADSLSLHSVWWVTSRRAAQIIEKMVLEHYRTMILRGEWIDEVGWQVAGQVDAIVERIRDEYIIRIELGWCHPPGYDPDDCEVATPEEIAAMMEALKERSEARRERK